MSTENLRPLAPTRNYLLRALPEDQRGRLMPLLTPMELPMRCSLLKADAAVEAAYFIEAGTVSMITTMEDGAQIEVGMAGREGFVGLSLLTGGETSPLDGLVQIKGRALRMPAASFRTALDELPALRPLLLRYLDTFLFQVSQTAACNGRHPIEQRLARWLLMEHDRAEADNFPITQEFLSALLGVRRPGVTVAMGTLQKAGLITHRLGQLHVCTREGLEEASCECYAAVQRRFKWLMDSAGQP